MLRTLISAYECNGHPRVLIIAADELSSLFEMAYLLRSPANADRPLTALGDHGKVAVFGTQHDVFKSTSWDHFLHSL